MIDDDRDVEEFVMPYVRGHYRRAPGTAGYSTLMVVLAVVAALLLIYFLTR
ncbi:hypothetical protein GCM10009681_48150 [Luedemannella helvata]|uniref:Uncharacterized protein n=1 Tax=Luedemannella helvata TaxID=349315 RepID=A0ABN2L307_9ACTN